MISGLIPTAEDRKLVLCQLGGILSGFSLFTEMVLSTAVHSYVAAQTVPWLMRVYQVLQQEERGAQALAPLVCSPGISHQNQAVG